MGVNVSSMAVHVNSHDTTSYVNISNDNNRELFGYTLAEKRELC